LIKKWFKNTLYPSLDWIQVELTSYCNASCIYCPRHIYKDAWINRNLSLNDFERLKPAFKKTHLVYLQGWGEPFLNTELFTMVNIAKEAGCKVGTTTNGMLLNEENIYRIVESNIDILAFSLAGVNKGNDEIRQGTKFDKILEAVKNLQKIKKKLGKKLPAINIAYILLRSRLDDIELLPDVLKDLDITQVVVSTLDFVPCKELIKETIIPSNFEEYEKIRSRLDKVKFIFEKSRTAFHYLFHRPEERNLECTENIQRALFVSAEGKVSPCVFLNLPVSPQSVCLYRNNERQYHHITFGDINEIPISEIWRDKIYRVFRETFLENKLPEICKECPKLFVT